MPTVRYLFKIIVLAGLYSTLAWAGLQFDAVGGFATLVWPPAGVGLAALLLFGFKMWPGIFVGAFLVNLFTGAPALSAIGMGAGNTIEGLFIAYLLRRTVNFRNSLDRVMDVLRFLIFSALGSLIAATIGSLSLLFGGVIDSSGYLDTWLAWWVGDTLGIQIMGSFLIVWLGVKINPNLSWRKFSEVILLFFSLISLSYITFSAGNGNAYPVTYLVVLPVIWSALSFGTLGVTAIVAILPVISIWGTSAGHGPFVQTSLAERLLYLQVFMGSISFTGMILSAVASERGEKERQLSDANQNLEERVEERTFELRRAQEIIDRSFEGVMIAAGDEKHLIEYVNPAWETLTGWKSEEVVRKFNPRVLKSGKMSPEFYHSLWGTILGGRLFTAEIVNKRKDGTFYDAEITIFRITTKDNRHYYVEVSRDITEHKKLEAKLAEYSKGLEDKVAERTKELEEKIAELEKLNKFMIGRELKMIELKEEVRQQHNMLEELREKLPLTTAKSRTVKKPKHKTDDTDY